MFLNLSGCTESVVCNLPKGMRIKGGLMFPSLKTYRVILPEDMVVSSSLSFAHHKGELTISEGLRAQFLFLNFCSNLTYIPENVKVGSISIMGCINLNHIADDLRVRREITYDDSTEFIKNILPQRLQSKLLLFTRHIDSNPHV